MKKNQITTVFISIVSCHILLGMSALAGTIQGLQKQYENVFSLLKLEKIDQALLELQSLSLIELTELNKGDRQIVHIKLNSYIISSAIKSIYKKDNAGAYKDFLSAQAVLSSTDVVNGEYLMENYSDIMGALFTLRIKQLSNKMHSPEQ